MCLNYIDSNLISFDVIVMSFGHILWPVRHQQDGYNLNSTSTMRQQPQMVGCLWELGRYVFRRSRSRAGDIGPMDRLPVKQNCRVP